MTATSEGPASRPPRACAQSSRPPVSSDLPFLRTSFPFPFSSQKLDIGLELVRKGYAVELPEDVEENRAVSDMLHDVVSEPLLSRRALLQGTARAWRHEAPGHAGRFVELPGVAPLGLLPRGVCLSWRPNSTA